MSIPSHSAYFGTLEILCVFIFLFFPFQSVVLCVYLSIKFILCCFEGGKHDVTVFIICYVQLNRASTMYTTKQNSGQNGVGVIPPLFLAFYLHESFLVGLPCAF